MTISGTLVSGTQYLIPRQQIRAADSRTGIKYYVPETSGVPETLSENGRA